MVPDYCIGFIANLDGCWISDYEEPNGIERPFNHDLELWCEFVCGDEVETESVTANYPEPGTFEERHVIENPCPDLVEG